MITRQRVGWVLLAVLLAIGGLARWLQSDWSLAWSIAFIVALCFAFWQLRETPSKPSKVFDFNPKRGLLFFVMGFVIFPFVALIGALFGDEITLVNVVMLTAFGSAFIGFIGVFTEHVGV